MTPVIILDSVINRYMKRLAKHPVIRKDAMFRSFIQDKEVSKTLKPIATFKTAIDTFKSRIDLFKAQVTVTERDAWFKVSSPVNSSKSGSVISGPAEHIRICGLV